MAGNESLLLTVQLIQQVEEGLVRHLNVICVFIPELQTHMDDILEPSDSLWLSAL